MSDAWGILAGLATLLVLRVVDYFLPKGWHYKNLEKYASRNNEDEEKKDET